MFREIENNPRQNQRTQSKLKTKLTDRGFRAPSKDLGVGVVQAVCVPRFIRNFFNQRRINTLRAQVNERSAQIMTILGNQAAHAQDNPTLLAVINEFSTERLNLGIQLQQANDTATILRIGTAMSDLLQQVRARFP